MSGAAGRWWPGVSGGCVVDGINSWWGSSWLVSVGVVALGSSPVRAGDPPFNAEVVGQWDGSNETYADVWGEGDYAYVGQFGGSSVLIIDVGDPTTPVLAAEYSIPPPNQSASAQDLKVGNGLLLIALEGNGGPGDVEIVDVRDPTNPTFVVTVNIDELGNPHNIFYDRGFLYMIDDDRIGIVDLRDLDPDDPPAEPITELLWLMEDVGTSFVHDVVVRARPSGETWLYASAWNSLEVYDATNVADEPPVFLASVGGDSSHSVWPTDDGRFLVTGEERPGGGITVFEVIETGGTVSLEFRDSVNLSIGEAFSVHNQFCVGNRVYNAWYGAGMRAYDIDPATGLLTLASSLYTSDAFWGIYPLLGTDRLLLSDFSNGLVIIADLAPFPETCDGDANGDGTVDPLDSGFVLARFGCSVGTGDPGCDAADQNGDGAVNPLDSGFVLARFGDCQ